MLLEPNKNQYFLSIGRDEEEGLKLIITQLKDIKR